MKKFEVWIEEVPSENMLYPTNFKTGMRFLSKKGKDFRERAILAFKQASLPRFSMEEALVIEFIIYWRNMRRSDPANYMKAPIDALKVGGFIEDDWIVMPRCMGFFYPDHPDRQVLKGVQGIMMTIYQEKI